MADRTCPRCLKMTGRVTRGYCKRCYDVLLKAGKLRLVQPRIDYHVWLASMLDEPGCWRWPNASPKTGGYGRVMFNSTSRPVHRLTYELLVGPIPDGLVIDHLCHNSDESCRADNFCLHRGCCNPDHLEAITQGENSRRGRSICGDRGRQTHCIHGHPLAGDNLRVTGDGERVCMTCARDRNIRYNARKRGAEQVALGLAPDVACATCGALFAPRANGLVPIHEPGMGAVADRRRPRCPGGGTPPACLVAVGANMALW